MMMNKSNYILKNKDITGNFDRPLEIPYHHKSTLFPSPSSPLLSPLLRSLTYLSTYQLISRHLLTFYPFLLSILNQPEHQGSTLGRKKSFTETLSNAESTERVQVPAKRHWDVQEKIEILDKLRNLRYFDTETGFLREVPVEKAAESLYVPPHTLKRWVKNEDRIRTTALEPKRRPKPLIAKDPIV
ncbi:hypothetical protein UA08_00172 [Talaromyces atroroseus]|uniref:Uncharacterized protein n=1 Tax=Talaromyces atroroseus TaxID=1441469 RepID=A0A225AYC8_TALAT|nr:hypothetical protein UA08_00172 [Talaromyces atroroseus]OKL64643.1 hypothetical protein UA08_00172 [Talaromyces atroroseus]